MTRKIDWDLLKAAGRTAGALMVGNFFVAVLVNGNTRWL